MKRFLLALLLACGVAQADTTGNLITNPTFNGTTGWSTTGMVGGRQYHPAQPANGTGYSFSYSQGTIAQTYAINQALSNVGAGIQIQGFDYGFQYQIYCANNVGGYCENPNGTIDSLSYTATITNSGGQSIYTNSQNLSGGYMPSPANIDVQQRFANPYEITSLGNFSISFTGQDGGFWGGNYGPTINNVYSKAVYTVDQCVVNPQSSPSCPGFKTFYNMTDDGYARVNLPFAFPFYGQLFTTSYMYTNGVVGFLNNNWGFCCDGTDLNGQINNPNSPWNYAIYALNTDLIPGPNSEFYTQVTDGGTGLKYSWVNVPEIGTDLNNTFHVQIKDSGYIGITHDQINLSPGRNPLIGIAGDISQGQYSVRYFGPASNMPNLVGTTSVYTGTESTNICAVNPLASPSCPNYASAYHNQQCSINPLYASDCPGYATAYFTQQCSANALYDPSCPGYATAYLNEQCSLDSLYSTQCPGYSAAYLNQQCSLNPLYDSSCSGYQTAVNECSANPLLYTYCPSYQTAVSDCSANGLTHSYCPSYSLEQQLCSTDPLSNQLCSGYQAAVTSCSANPLTASYCPNYQTATTTCSANPLSAEYCPNYQTATSTCASNPLTASYCPTYQSALNSCNSNALTYSYCPGYQTALNTCSINPLSNQLCSGYQTATTQCNSNQLLYTYCPAYTTTLASCSTNPQSNSLCPGYGIQIASATETTTSVASTTEAAPSISSDGTVTTTVSATGDKTVDSVVNTTATSASPAQAATATVPLTPAPASTPTQTVVAAKTEEKKSDDTSKPDAKKEDTQTASNTPKEKSDSGNTKTETKTARQQIAEKRAEAAKMAAVKAGNDATEKMDSATSMEQQVAVQNVVIQAMGFTPGFDAYKFIMPDGIGYKPFAIYKEQKTVDNNRMLRGLTGASDRLHTQMVDEQYR